MKDEVTLYSCIAGNIGTVWVDKKDTPGWIIVVAADFCYLFGCMKDKMNVEMINLFYENCSGKIIMTYSQSWILFLETEYLSSFKRFKRYAFKSESITFDKKRLNDFILNAKKEFQIKRFDESMYYMALKDGFTADFCCYFSSLKNYLENGTGYGIVHNGEIISGASSYTYCSGKIEITIGTKNEYRHRGLALACASKLILDCLERNIIPRWDAANLESVALAKKLGYIFEKEYEVYSI